MPEIKTEIIINAPIGKIWAVLMDFYSYNAWNPFILSIKGKKQLNERLVVVINPLKKKKMVFKPKILSLKEKEEFSWKGSLLIPGIFDGQHNFLLKLLPDNNVLFLHTEKFSGILSRPIFKLIKESTQLGFVQMNEALKKECELSGR